MTFHGYDFSAEPRAHGAAMYDILFETADVVTFNCEHARRAHGSSSPGAPTSPQPSVQTA